VKVLFEKAVPRRPDCKLQVGWSSWRDGDDLSVRFWVHQAGDPNKFNRINSPEVPAWLPGRMLELAREYGPRDESKWYAGGPSKKVA
jgi:hypothetical protein